MKLFKAASEHQEEYVALFTRAWIEMGFVVGNVVDFVEVALFTRAWIEIDVDSVELDENGKSPS